jgi:hypothetical protein
VRRWIVLAFTPVIACGDNSHLAPGLVDAQPGQDAAPDTRDAPAMLALTDQNGIAITQLDLGTLSVGNTRAASLRVINTGSGPTAPIALSVSGADVSDFLIDSAGTTCSSTTLTPAQACAVVVDFAPSAAGLRNASLNVDAGGGTTSSLPLIGHALLSDLAITPGSVDFGMIQVTQHGTQTIAVQNVSTHGVSIDAIDVTGSGFALMSTTCGMMLPAGATCQITVTFAPSALGIVMGELAVISGSSTTGAPLSGDGGHYVEAAFDGAGGGTVTSNPTGIDCTGGACAALFDGTVVLTATPDATSVFVGWSDASCGSSTTCAVAAKLTSVEVFAKFTPIGGQGAVEVTYAGNGTGEVDVSLTDGHFTSVVACFASCSVPTSVGDTVGIGAYTADTLGGITGACSTTTQDCEYTAPFGISSVTVTFNADAAEQWTRYFGDEVLEVAHDTSGNVIAATATQLFKLTSAGAAVWTSTVPITALATGPADTIYVVTGSNVEKLDASGNVLWTAAVDTKIKGGCPQQCLAVGANGSVAMKGATDGLALWDANGNALWALSLAPNLLLDGLAIDALGTIYATYDDAAVPNVLRFLPDGTELPVWDGSIVGWDGVAGEDPGNLGVDADGEIIASWQGFGQSGFARTKADGSADYARVSNDGSTSTMRNGVTASTAHRIAWWYNFDDLSGFDYFVHVFADDNTDIWSMHHTVPSVSHPNDACYGNTQLVIGGYFGGSSRRGFVQAFAP